MSTAMNRRSVLAGAASPRSTPPSFRMFPARDSPPNASRMFPARDSPPNAPAAPASPGRGFFFAWEPCRPVSVPLSQK